MLNFRRDVLVPDSEIRAHQDTKLIRHAEEIEAPSPPPVLEAQGVTRRFGSSWALRGVDLSVRAGESVAVLGPNGAGKTTLIKILGLSLSPTAGGVRLLGTETSVNPAGVRELVGFVGHRTGLYQNLSPRENLRFYGRVYGISLLEARIQTVLDELRADRVADQPVRTLSRGIQQRVALARAILHDPIILLMDEPETGLDRDAQEWLGDLVHRWVSIDRCVVFSTHRFDWAARVAGRAIVLRDGLIHRQLDLAAHDERELARAYELSLTGSP